MKHEEDSDIQALGKGATAGRKPWVWPKEGKQTNVPTVFKGQEWRSLKGRLLLDCVDPECLAKECGPLSFSLLKCDEGHS